MITAYLLIYIPILLFVAAFLYETFLSFLRLKNPKAKTFGYLDATWEVTNTLLIFGVVMLLMLFTKSIDRISDAIFTSTLLAGGALLVRAACYIYIFYVRTSKRLGLVDWLFALSHVAAAGLLVVTVVKATWFLYKQQPEANLQFIPYFLPGLVVVLAICCLPLMRLYRTK
jgi:uncharacterized membrane protein SirB2